MSRLLPIVAAAVAKDIKGMMARIRRMAVLGAIGALFALTSYVAAVAAAAIYLARAVGVIEAALIVSAISALVVLMIVIAMMISSRRHKRRRKLSKRIAGLAATATLVPTAIRSKTLLAAVAVGGLIALAVTSARSDASD